MFMDDLRDKIRLKHYSYKTEQTYTHWVKRFILFNGKRHPKDMGYSEIEAFLLSLAKSNRSGGTQNQARAAILFMYQELLGVEIQNSRALLAKNEKRLPAILERYDTLRV